MGYFHDHKQIIMLDKLQDISPYELAQWIYLEEFDNRIEVSNIKSIHLDWGPIKTTHHFLECLFLS